MENFLSDDQTVGTLLKKEREKQNKTIQDVADMTNIRTEFLKSIENDNFDELPSKLHITGFLKVYSHYLGIPEQEILFVYKRQILLLQEVPSEEIFSITKKKQVVIPQKKIILFLVFILAVFTGIYFLAFSKKEEIPQAEFILNDTESSMHITVEKGKNFTLNIKGIKNTYKLLDITDKSISLVNLTDEVIIPPFLYLESLQYDIDEDNFYDYMISFISKEKEQVTFEVSIVNIPKNPGQLNYAIILLDNNTIELPDWGVLSIKNLGISKMNILFLNQNNETISQELNPMQVHRVVYFTEEQKSNYESVYIQNIKNVQIQMDYKDIKLIKQNIQSGEIGILRCTNPKEKEIICDINVDIEGI